jgi:hypothetical protein
MFGTNSYILLTPFFLHSQVMADMEANIVKAQEIRAEEKKNNSESMEESKNAQGLIQNAISVLQDFYSSQSLAEQSRVTSVPQDNQQQAGKRELRIGVHVISNY